MAPSPSSDPTGPAPLTAPEAEVLLDVAEATLDAALTRRRPALVPLEALPAALQRPGGVFVTLTVDGELNGCIGTVEGTEPLGHAVARLALSAAYEDPRLPSLRPTDRPGLTIEVSLLTAPIPTGARDHGELLTTVRPGRDGLVVEADGRRALLLPTVWEQLPDPVAFTDQLWLKAGLRPGTWPTGLEVSRFEAHRHERPAPGASPTAA